MNIVKHLKKYHKDGKFGKILSILFSLLVLAIFISLFAFLIYSAIPAFKNYEIFNTTEFNLSMGKASIWMPLSITLLVTVISLLIATPIGIKTATFIKYRMNKKNSKRLFIIIQTLAGIPSVVFGLFALTALGNVVKFVFNIQTVYTIINATIMLSFMILPTIISLTINTYDSIDNDQLLNPISLGITKTSSIYKIIKKEARGGIIVAIIIAIGRTVGETMALSMILNNSDSYEPLKNGTINLLTESLGTLGSVIASNLFSESGGPEQRAVLYLFGIFLLFLVIFLNIIIMFLTSKKNRCNKSFIVWRKIENKISNIVMWIPKNLMYFYFSTKNKMLGIDCTIISTNEFVAKKIEKDKTIKFRDYWLLSLEILCTIISFGFLAWIIIDIAINGFNVIFSNPESSIFEYSKNTTGQAFINTVLIIIFSLSVAIPIGLFSSIYLVEYCKNEKFKKTVFFFIDSISSSPSIIFGMFGLTMFIRTFGLTGAGTIGRSLIAGALTISIVVLPSLIRMFERSLSQVSNTLRESGIAMGLNKWTVTMKIVLPVAYKSMVSSTVLTTGRIMSETAPLYLTAGLSSASHTSLLNPGQTLTTRIYSQTINSNNLNQLNASYESAFLSLILILLLIYLGYVIIPNWKNIKQNFYNYLIMYKKIYNRVEYIDKEIICKQKVGKILYISYSQMKEYNLNKKVDKKIIINNKIYNIKYLQDERINKMIASKSIYI